MQMGIVKGPISAILMQSLTSKSYDLLTGEDCIRRIYKQSKRSCALFFVDDPGKVLFSLILKYFCYTFTEFMLNYTKLFSAGIELTCEFDHLFSEPIPVKKGNIFFFFLATFTAKKIIRSFRHKTIKSIKKASSKESPPTEGSLSFFKAWSLFYLDMVNVFNYITIGAGATFCARTWYYLLTRKGLSGLWKIIRGRYEISE